MSACYLIGLAVWVLSGIVLGEFSISRLARGSHGGTRLDVHLGRFLRARQAEEWCALAPCWLVAKGCDTRAVQEALNLHQPRPCTWTEWLPTEEDLFIAPPINGWILVSGSRLPDPGENVDECFRFVLELSRKVGTVQMFTVQPGSNHHAWIWVEDGRVLRAYAWAGETVWSQGSLTTAEIDLKVACFQYAEPLQMGQLSRVRSNLQKVPSLAARWGLDPRSLQNRKVLREQGLAGTAAEPS